MSQQQLEELGHFLTANWYDREEDDQGIIAYLRSTSDVSYFQHAIELINIFLEDKLDSEFKSHFVRNSVWRYFPKGNAEAPIDWLRTILLLLEKTVVEWQS